ncbi:MAG: hypothetical protein CMB81_06070 [Flammeovirgaceae bacterium]|nr:hypothetical protein [Flammeovirgaceae bacterium]|tara:strand:+ start:833 stop:3013 length:2181 start_codon:yes stop_codon:yes gene_type:complete
MTVFDHNKLQEEYDNENDSIAKDFIVPCLQKCLKYRRATYSFTSSSLNSWAGSLAYIIDKNVKIEILCDMSVLCQKDDNLHIGIEKSTDPITKEKFIRSWQDDIFLEAYNFDLNDRNQSAKRNILDWLLISGQLELKFAYPKERPPSRINVKYHKKMGYFQFSKDEYIAFKGSWNETLLGGGINGEECDVYSSEKESDISRCKRTITKVDNDWDNKNKKFLNIPVSKKVMKIIKSRAPKSVQEIIDEFPDLYELLYESGHPNEEDSIVKPTQEEIIPSEKDLREYQLKVIEHWENNDRLGLVEHATGTGKTWTAIFALKRYLITNQIGLILVPSDLLQKQWSKDVKFLIPNARILHVGGGYKSWKKELKRFSKPDSESQPKIIIAILDSASSDEFLEKINDEGRLMLIADEVHRVGSNHFSKVLKINSDARLGLSATPRRYGDPIGTKKIYDYFRNKLEPIIGLQDVIGTALVPYQYFPKRCYLSEEELDDWDELTQKIKKAYAMSPSKNGKKVPSSYFKTLLIQRSKIAKNASSKISAATNIIKEFYEAGQRWLIYCDSLAQIEQVYQSLSKNNISSMQYYSDMKTESKNKTKDIFENEGGILISIKCLDEGIDIPSITHALIIASDQNPRQFIQRRGRVLRQDKKNNKKRAYLHDLVVSVNENSNHKNTDTLLIAELKRAYEFALNAENASIAQSELRLVSRGSGIKTSEIIDSINEEIDSFEE